MRNAIPIHLLLGAFVLVHCVAAQGADLQAEVELLQSKPDVSITSSFDFNARPAVVATLLDSPMLIARLWDASGFTPRYKARPQGDCIHVDDPTGIQGDLCPVEQAANRRVWVGFGSLNHALVPSLKGRMAVLLTTEPSGSGVSAHLELYVRVDSRALGFLTSTFFPLVRNRVEHRVAANAADLGSILAEVSANPQRAAAHLSKADAAALLHATGVAGTSK